VHADLWAANVLWEKDSDGNATDKLAAIIDWQCLHLGNPCEDLVRILNLNTSGKYRRENEAKLLEYYAEKVAEFMGGNAPFTLEQVNINRECAHISKKGIIIYCNV
jgi:aminoglycoside phosphotransferase (APT) family kinase protein